MDSKKLTIIIVNFNSSSFIELSLHALKFLTKNSFEVFIVDNGSKVKDYKKLKKIVQKHKNVQLKRFDTELRGSLAHGTALNYLSRKVKTPFFSILDADAVWLKKDWDEILIKRIDRDIKVIGTQAPESKPQDFPLMFAILFETKTFNKLNIDFRPKNANLKQDTGWELREKYLKNGHKGENLDYFSTRDHKKGPFRKVICGEYYLKGERKIFASHFGRGSSASVGKYKKGNKSLLGKIPVIRNVNAKKIAKKEKEEWISICRKIINREVLSGLKNETTPCDFCGSTDHEKLFSADVLYNDLPGKFSIVKCQKCNLVFTNPRPTRESMNFFYPEDGTGYLKRNRPQKKKGISAKIYRAVLREYFGYFPREKNNFLTKITLFPVFVLKNNFLRTEGVVNFIEEGRLLDVGCSSGVFLSEMKSLGWRAKGIEPSEKASRHAKEKLSLDVACSDIDSYQAKEKFDVITMRMVLEHVYSPSKILKKVNSMLKDGGTLVLIVPDFSGFESWLYGKYAYTLQVPNHLFHFTPKTIRKYLRKAGFKGSVKTYHHSFDRDMIASLIYIKNKKSIRVIQMVVRNKLVRFLLVRSLVRIISWLGKTSRMTIHVKK